jgi:hypothetical protein
MKGREDNPAAAAAAAAVSMISSNENSAPFMVYDCRLKVQLASASGGLEL